MSTCYAKQQQQEQEQEQEQQQQPPKHRLDMLHRDRRLETSYDCISGAPFTVRFCSTLDGGNEKFDCKAMVASIMKWAHQGGTLDGGLDHEVGFPMP